jgi:hypothetical protein
VVAWIICLISFEYNISSDGSEVGVLFGMIFSMYWTLQVIKNILHTTIAGVVGTWYFNDDSILAAMPPVTWSSFKR